MTQQTVQHWIDGATTSGASTRTALKVNGVLPSTNYHRLHVVPPCTTTDDEAREMLTARDVALTRLDAVIAADAS